MEKIKNAIKKNQKLYFFLLKIYIFILNFIRNRNLLYIPVLKIKMLKDKRYRFNSYKINSIKDFCSFKGLKYLVIEKKQMREVCIPKYYGFLENEIIKTAMSPEIYIAELTDAEIIGGNSFVVVDDCCLYDMAIMDNEKRYDMRSESLKTIYNDSAYLVSIDANETFNEAIFLIGLASNNYFHFTVELISRFKYIDSYEEYRSIPILIDERILDIPQFYELLQIMNRFNHELIPIKREYRYKVKRLVYSSYNIWMPINVKDGEELVYQDFIVAESGIKYVRNTVLNSLLNEAGYPIDRKIFISRKNYSNQRLANEEKVLELFRNYGFEIIYPEDLSFSEQVKLFYSAEYIAGSSGAAFTNIIYCRENTKIICILPKKYNFYMYSTIGKMLQLTPVFLDAKVVSRNRKISGDQYRLDLKYCQDFLQTL